MALDLKEELVAALLDPRVQESHAKVLESILDNHARRAAAPLVGAQEAARLLKIKSKDETHAVRALHERLRRDPELAALKRKLGARVVFDRAALEQYISQRTKGADRV